MMWWLAIESLTMIWISSSNTPACAAVASMHSLLCEADRGIHRPEAPWRPSHRVQRQFDELHRGVGGENDHGKDE
jgi:hypothetical protein